MKLIRGVRNNNPGNIKVTAIHWEGERSVENGFCVFDNPYYGIRAMVKILMTYKKKHQIETIEEIINRWSATDQEEYIKFVSKHTGTDPQMYIDLEDPINLQDIVYAMIWFENGFEPYTLGMVWRCVEFAINGEEK